jgi:hypothetical protein
MSKAVPPNPAVQDQPLSALERRAIEVVLDLR